MELSHAQEHYIETIFELTLEHGHAHVKEIAQRIGIKMASVTEAVRNLSELGLVHYKARQAVTLTVEGENFGRELHSRHRILAEFLHAVMGSPADRANTFACQIEHIVDKPFIHRLSSFIKFLKHRDPDLISAFQSHYQKDL